MATDLYTEMLQNDGEGITFGDMNDAQRFLAARLNDQLLGNLIGGVSLTATDGSFGGQNGANPPTHLAYALHPGQAYLKAGSATNKVKIAPGVLLQKIGNADGANATLIAFMFDGTTEVTITAGDGSHPRVDLIQMKLEYVDADVQTRDVMDAVTGAPSDQTPSKKHRVQCTISVKVGTPAVSPTYPDPDAGYVAIAGVVVGTSYLIATQIEFGTDVAGAKATVHDQRMPLNVQGHLVPPTAMIFDPASGTWAFETARNGVISGDNNQFHPLIAMCPVHSGRLVGVGVYQDSANALGAITVGNGVGSSGIDRENVRNSITVGAVSSVQVPYYTFEAAHAPGVGPTVQASATNKIGPPLWANGLRCAVPGNASATLGSGFDSYMLILYILASLTHTAQIVSHVRFLIAGGI